MRLVITIDRDCRTVIILSIFEVLKGCLRAELVSSLYTIVFGAQLTWWVYEAAGPRYETTALSRAAF